MSSPTSPKIDVTHRYRYLPSDFIKHLASTTLVIAILTVVLSALFREPVRAPLKIDTVATQTPLLFEQVAMGDLTGTGEIASYGPPYNNGSSSVQSPLQRAVGVIHPVYPKTDFILTPLKMAAHLDPQVGLALREWYAAPPSQEQAWATAYQAALGSAHVRGDRVVVAPGNYGPVPAMMQGLLQLGQSGLMTGALDRSPADYQFDNMNSLLFIQGKPMQDAASRLELLGNQWGIIHEENAPYPGPWWMTIVTAIYQIPYIANASSGDAMALTLGLLMFLLLMLAPWIPGLNRLPRYLGVYRLIWRDYYARYETPAPKPPVR
jgi:hypothetical protein